MHARINKIKTFNYAKRVFHSKNIDGFFFTGANFYYIIRAALQTDYVVTAVDKPPPEGTE